jgi:ATP-dependent Clp protease ATP-binding subunit ClpA
MISIAPPGVVPASSLGEVARLAEFASYGSGMERFSERARRVVEVADQEARQLDHPYLGTEHLLLGLIAVEGPAHYALVSAGATADATRAKIAEAVAVRSSGQVSSLELSPRARRAVDRASRLSLQRRDPQVDPEHLLVGVLDVEGRAGQALRGLGVDVAALRLAIDLPRQNLGSDDQSTSTSPSSAAPSPHCAACKTSLDGQGLAYRIIVAEDEQGRCRNFAVTSCAACGAVIGASPS